MAKNKLKSLTPEQEALIPVIREKWRAIVFSKGLINRSKAKEAVKVAYSAIGKKEPEIIFFDSPYAALNSPILNRKGRFLGNLFDLELKWKLEQQLMSHKARQFQYLAYQLDIGLLMGENELDDGRSRLPSSLLLNQLKRQSSSQFLDGCVQPQLWACRGGFYDFCFSVLNCTHDKRKWSAFQLLVNNCGWIYHFENACFVCDRPTQSSIDHQNRLHAEGKPAIKFADGYSLYSYHGVSLPEKYGKVHPQQWPAKWLLEEDNAELKRVLIKGIGYAQICQELQAAALDTWQEYTLLKIDNNVDAEPVYLLKMTCPSTGFIHALRVPPDVNSAREAIRWVNWGIDPEEFSVQT